MDDEVWRAAVRLRSASVKARARDKTAACVAYLALSRTELPATLRRLAAQILALCDEHEAALEVFKSADRLLPGQAGIFSEIAACCGALGDIDQSRAWLRKAAMTDPLDSATLREWLLLESRWGDGELVVATLAALRQAELLNSTLEADCRKALEARECVQTPPATREAGRSADEHGAVGASLACLSLPKTGSMALASGLKDAGFTNVLHLHFFGPKGLSLRQRSVEAQRAPVPPMLNNALTLSARFADQDHVFRFVTCVRDPVARIVSQAFENAERHLSATGIDITRDASAIVEWYEHLFGQDVAGAWLDDCYKSTFGFDFRLHPFDHERRSLRFESKRLKLLILRQEDGIEAKQRELGWLVDRESVTIPLVNLSRERNYSSQYRAMTESFVAPQRWIDRFYSSDATLHFYTRKEIYRFRSMWSNRERSRAK